MVPEQKPSLKNTTIGLISQAELSLGMFRGRGLGAVLLAVIALVLITQPSFSPAEFYHAMRAHLPTGK